MESLIKYIFLIFVFMDNKLVFGHDKDAWITAGGLEEELCQEDLKHFLKTRYQNASINKTEDDLYYYSPDVVVDSRFKEDDDSVNCFGLEKLGFMLRWFAETLPASSESVNTHFYMSTRKNSSRTQIRRDINMDSIDFDPTRKTVLVIHGFMSNSNATWVRQMTNAFLNWGDVNVIAVDWSGGGNTWKYWKAVANTRTAGCDIQGFMEDLIIKKGLKVKDVHCVGHSLGAHICSYAAHNLGGFSRITGLDPAQPCFQTTDIHELLDPTDADFVDIIHTNGRLLTKLGLGMPTPSGHADFYPNGGMKQPGCKVVSGFWDSILPIKLNDIQQAICSHGRSYDLLTESLLNNDCNFMASDWNLSYEGALASLQGDACRNPGSCPLMGIAAVGGNRAPRANGTYVLVTKDKSPFCTRKIKSSVLSDLLQDLLTGFNLNRNKKETVQFAFSDDVDLQPGFQCLTNVSNSALTKRQINMDAAASSESSLVTCDLFVCRVINRFHNLFTNKW